jgi:hypothetical protein
MNKGRVIIYSSLAILSAFLLGVASRTTLSYSETCLSCLQEAGGVEKSIFGITYSHVEKQRRSERGGFISYVDGTKIEPIDPRAYREIAGHECEHTFVRGGFCRYRSGGVGCGSFGGPRHEFRKELMENLYRAYRRVPDRALARETLEVIERHYPISLVTNKASSGPRPPIEFALQIDELANEPLGILYRGLALMNNSAEWRQVLDAASSGDGSLKLLVDPASLAQRLDNPDPGIRWQIIDQLAALKDPGAWTAIANCLKDRHTREHAARQIVFSGHVEFFEAVFRADELARIMEHAEKKDPAYYTPDIFDQLISKYSAQEIRDLLSRKQPYVDRIAFAAIRRQSRFEFIDEVLAILNERPSSSAAATLESLFQGPNPFDPGRSHSGEPRLDPWDHLVANTTMKPVDSLASYTEGGKKSILKSQQIVKLGLQRDPARWSELHDLYMDSVQQLGGEISSTAIAQAMAESDRAKTLAFLFSQLDPDYSRMGQTCAAIGGLGAIADPSALEPLLAFIGKNIVGAGPIKEHPSYQPIIGCALHRCRGSQRWKLVKNPDSTYSIEK